MKLLCYIIFLTTIISCSPPQEIQPLETPVEKSQTEVLLKLDTNEIQKRILNFIDSNYNTSIGQTDTNALEANFFVIDTIIKTELTGDNFNDYFILTAQGNWPLIQGLFFNGKSGNKIPLDSAFPQYPISRFSMSYKVLKSNYDSLKNSIITGSTATGCYGESVHLFQYNPNSKQMEITLNINTAKGCFSDIKGVFFSNLFSGYLNNCDTIKIFKGKDLDSEKNYKFQTIIKAGNKPLETYTFNKKTFRWEKNVW